MDTEPRNKAPERLAAVCLRCGTALSEGEIVAVGEETYCQPCVKNALHGTPGRAGPRRHKPFVAAMLAVVPGFGQVYNGQLRRGIVFAALLLFSVYKAASVSGSIWPEVVMFIWVFSAFDAYSSAGRLNAGESLRDDLLGELAAQDGAHVRLLWGVVLIALGLMFLMENVLPQWLSFEKTWPTLAIAVGAWLVYSCIREDRHRGGGPAA